MENFKNIIPKESVPGARHTAQHNEVEFDVYKLIHATKELPETTVVIEDYLSGLDDLCWTDANKNSISPRAVVAVYKSQSLEQAKAAHPELAEHLQRIHTADYSHPILILGPESKLLDGMHRLAKAYADGQLSIKAKIITSIPEAAIIKIHQE